MEDYKKIALKLAKYSILEEFDPKYKASLENLKNIIITTPYEKLLEKRASFVTLKKWGKQLRWCIWSILPVRKLYEDIIINAKNAAFLDPRFEPLRFDELEDLYLETTILSPLKMVKFETIEQLLQFLAENRPGLFIKLWPYSATFLPSVWEELPDPEQFLIHLIYKAWLTPQAFVENFKDVEIYYYTGEEFGDRFKNI